MLTTDGLIRSIKHLDKDFDLGVITREVRQERVSTLETEWRASLAEENGIDDLPQTAQDAVFALAYEHGHASGYDDIANHYAEFAESGINIANSL